ncbi:MAG: nuclear transport factor 2 family protein [Pyrinomonadaceae bacterium]
MRRLSLMIATLAAAAFVVACGAPAGNTGTAANSGNAANSNANKTAAAPAPSKETLMTMEKAAWEAWKNRDAKWTEENASDKYIGFGSSGRMDKAASIKSYEQKCEIKTYTLSDDQMQMVGPDVAVLTFKATQDYTCDGKKGPADVHSTSIYVREGDKWKAAFYAETPVVDPKAPPKPAAAKKEEPKADEAKPDAATEALLAVEKKTWEAWKNKDAKALEDVLAKDFVFVTGTGRMDHAATIKSWATENKCDVKSYWIGDARSASLSKDVSMMTFKGGGEGTCEGQPIATDWYVGLYMKDGEVWRPAFGMGIPQQ